MEAFARRLRKAGFNGWIAVGNWRVKTLDGSVKRRLKEAGVDYSSHRLHAVCRIISYATASLFDTPETAESSTAIVPEIELIIDKSSEEKRPLGELATVVP